MFLNSGVDPMTAVRGGLTPLHVALAFRDYHTASLLWDWGSDVDRPTNNYTEVRYDLARGQNFTPLDMALMNLCDPEMARFLLAGGSKLDSIFERYPIADT